MGLIEGFDKMEFRDVSLSKPFLRKALERSLGEISSGSRNKVDVLNETVSIYREAFAVSSQKMTTLVDECRSIIQANSN